jgi:hypothetical protein
VTPDEAGGAGEQHLHGDGTVLADSTGTIMPVPRSESPFRPAPVLVDGLLAGLLSTAALVWRSRRDTGRTWPALNAPSHWVWGREALRADDADGRHTGWGSAIHHGSSIFWAVAYRWLRARREHATPLNAALDASAVATVAALVDLRCTPERFTPGFERRLRRRSLPWVYGSFALGLALSSWIAANRDRSLQVCPDR